MHTDPIGTGGRGRPPVRHCPRAPPPRRRPHATSRAHERREHGGSAGRPPGRHPHPGWMGAGLPRPAGGNCPPTPQAVSGPAGARESSGHRYPPFPRSPPPPPHKSPPWSPPSLVRHAAAPPAVTSTSPIHHHEGYSTPPPPTDRCPAAGPHDRPAGVRGRTCRRLAGGGSRVKVAIDVGRCRMQVVTSHRRASPRYLLASW